MPFCGVSVRFPTCFFRTVFATSVDSEQSANELPRVDHARGTARFTTAFHMPRTQTKTANIIWTHLPFRFTTRGSAVRSHAENTITRVSK